MLALSRRWQAELGEEPFEPDWDRIFAMERAGAAMIWTARSLQGALVGYMFVTFTNGIFFSSTRFARILAGYLAPEWRAGTTGLRYIRSTLDAIDQLGAFRIEWETNDRFEPDDSGRSRLAGLLKRLGFEQVGTVMRRRDGR